MPKLRNSSNIIRYLRKTVTWSCEYQMVQQYLTHPLYKIYTEACNLSIMYYSDIFKEFSIYFLMHVFHTYYVYVTILTT